MKLERRLALRWNLGPLRFRLSKTGVSVRLAWR